MKWKLVENFFITGQKCSNSTSSFCKPPLVCRNNSCQMAVGLDGNCSIANTFCNNSLVCFSGFCKWVLPTGTCPFLIIGNNSTHF